MKSKENTRTKRSRLGWGILLTISCLLALNGVTWFFFGPQRVKASLEAYPQAYATIAPEMVTNARQVAIWYLAFGLLAFWTGLRGYRSGSRRASYIMWIQTAVLVVIGLLYRDGFGIYLLGLAPVALIGHLLAGHDQTADSPRAMEA